MSNNKNQISPETNTVVLAGGVGGAKLAEGFTQLVEPDQLTIVVNSGDDFQHLGLTVCPDLDTVMYLLAGVANAETGWGRAGESWRTIGEVAKLGGADWFRLGDLDLATHLVRTSLLDAGETLTAVTHHLCQQLNIQHTILPMSDKPTPTMIETDDGILPFQTWFVKERWQPTVKQIILPEDARASKAVAQALQKADLVLIAPSNPFVSVDTILNCFPIREMVMDLPKAVIAVSPIVGGDAVKGPAAKMMQERGMDVSETAVANHYGDLIDGFVYDTQDKGKMDNYPKPTLCTNTMMIDASSRKRVAQELITFALELTR
ncbi:MAG: 2-phospho-L-lactate transferase [Chloroflexi bacterium]|nr:MAG: 2-phospho-L-lactate transferase [Chloroflexota bacterium]